MKIQQKILFILTAILACNLNATGVGNKMQEAFFDIDFPTIKNLIENGTENVHNTYDQDPLIFAAIGKYIDIKLYPNNVLSLRKTHGDTRDIPTLLHDAKKILVFLLENGAPINNKGYEVEGMHLGKTSGQTALHAAVDKNLPEIVEILLDHRADTTIKDKKGLTAFELAVQKGQTLHDQLAKKNNQKIKELLGQHKMRPGFPAVQTKTNTKNVQFKYL